MTDNKELQEFRAALTKAARVSKWDPSNVQLASLAKAVKQGTIRNTSDLQQVVSVTVPGTRFHLDEGLDMSDLRTLLQLANKLPPQPAN
jgi:hypothetical protein